MKIELNVWIKQSPSDHTPLEGELSLGRQNKISLYIYIVRVAYQSSRCLETLLAP